MKAIKAILRLVVITTLKKEVIEVLNTRRQKKEFCVPTHLTEQEALHVADMAGEREWSNSAYIRHLVKKDMERHLADSYLKGEIPEYATKQFECSVRNEQAIKNPGAVTPESVGH